MKQEHESCVHRFDDSAIQNDSEDYPLAATQPSPHATTDLLKSLAEPIGHLRYSRYFDPSGQAIRFHRKEAPGYTQSSYG
jgi:hypothetical protein